MNARIRRSAVALMALFGLLFLNLNYIQVIRAETLRNDPANARTLVREYGRERGRIVVGEGQEAFPVAESVPTDGRLEYLRRYPEGTTYAHLTGFHSLIFGRTELEQAFNDELNGTSSDVFARNLGDLLAGRERGGDAIVAAIDPAVQGAAVRALGGQRGAVVAMEPATGRILALVSSPTYDPNELSGHDPDAVRAAWDALEGDPENPRLNRAVREVYPPGSTFKLITAAAALESGLEPSTTFDDPVALALPQTTAEIRNFGRGTCAGGGSITLARALAVSCNTTFAQLGLDLGADALIEQAERFGFNQDLPVALPRPATSRIPKELDPPATAQTAIGQRDVRATPLQMAMVSAAIANGGELVTPRLVDRVEDDAGRLIREFRPAPLQIGALDGAAVSPATAAALQSMMVEVVRNGSGGAAAVPGVQVAGKTGTAENGPGEPPTVWFTGFAPAEDPRIAVAVVVDRGGNAGAGATGGSVAAPIARAVIEAAL